MYYKIKKELSKKLSKITKLDYSICYNSLEKPKSSFGDLACTLSFLIAKEQKTNPKEIAEDIAKKLKSTNIEKIETIGPYINIYFSKSFFEKTLNYKYKKQRKKEKILIEFPSVNPNKPWHIGHFRNAVLGNSVSHLMEYSGYTVLRMDYIDDLGLQVAQSLWGILNLNDKENEKFDQWIGKEYVKVASKMNDEKVNKEVEELLHKLETNDEKTSKKAREISEKCVKAQWETGFNFNIEHEILVFESDIMRTIFEEGMEKLKKNKIIHLETEGENKGCYVLKMSGGEYDKMKNPDKILIRSNGIATYTGKDIIFHLWKFGLLKNDFKYTKFLTQPSKKTAYMSNKKGKSIKIKTDKIINVIGIEQTYPQQVVKEALNKLGYKKEAENYYHLAYEHITLRDINFSGRKGTWIGYSVDDFIEEGIKKALEKNCENKEIAKTIATNSMIFYILKYSPETKIAFDWEDALKLEGDSAPYIMYSYVRCISILKNKKPISKISIKNIKINENEKKLLILLSQFSEIVEHSANELKPHEICDYLLRLSSEFSSFYNLCPVLKEENKEIQNFRLLILEKTAQTLKTGMNLLGLKELEKM
ncbi:MAG: arginine--tRNA ligase [Candidatus Micrarchaeia archaeon]|jgi:arginyl-tRNA synthetase